MGMPTFTPYVSDSFSLFGITDAKFKSVLPPGKYSIDAYPWHIISDLGAITWYVWGVPWGGLSAYGVDVSYYEPFMFYKFAQQAGTGGALWTGHSFEVAFVAPDRGFLTVVLELYHDIKQGVVISRGVEIDVAALNGRSGMFQGDTIESAIQLVYWAGQGLHEEYPDLFPLELPAINPEPYVPPAGDVLPSSTATGTPTGDWDLSPAPAVSSNPLSTPTG